MASDSHSRKIYEGTIFKKGQINKSWKSRWFVLYNSRRLAYFENQTSNEPIKQIDLSDVHSINIIPANDNPKNASKRHKAKVNYNNNNGFSDDEYDDSKLQRTESISVASATDRAFSFELTTPKRTYLLACNNSSELNEWIDHLEKSIFGGRLYQGWLIKRGAYRKSWKKRWFVIYDTQEMRYYDDQSRKEPKGLIKLHEVLLMCPGDKDQYSQPYTIQLMTPDRNWVLATQSQKERDEWFGRLEETIHGAKRLITSHEGYLWKRGQVVKSWKKRYFALSKGWLFYFEEQFHCNKFKSIAFFSEAFFNQAFRLYVKGSIPLHQTTVQKVDSLLMKKNGPKSQKNVFNDNDQTTSNKDEVMEKEYVFKIITEKREFQFATETKSDLEKWFKAFHSTHSSNGYNDEESEMTETPTITHTHDDEVDEYEDLLSGLSRNKSDVVDSDGNDNDPPQPNDNNNNNNQDEEKKEDVYVKSKLASPKAHNRSPSKTPLMDIIDPNGDAKWIDIENESVEQQQSDVLRTSLHQDK